MKEKDQDEGLDEEVCVHLYVSGIVQGVFFRAHTTSIARSLDLTGWVRNLDDGRVEIVAQGAYKSMSEFISWCKHGPPAAEVEKVETIWEEPIDDRKRFITRR